MNAEIAIILAVVGALTGGTIGCALAVLTYVHRERRRAEFAEHLHDQ